MISNASVDNVYWPLYPGQPGEAGTRKVKLIWILMKQEMMGWQWHQLDHMQVICTVGWLVGV